MYLTIFFKNPKCSEMKFYMSQGTTRSETVGIF